MSSVEDRITEVPDAVQNEDVSEADGARREDVEILTGKRKYTADWNPDDVLHAAVYRSPHAHANIEQVDLSAALEEDGVVAGFVAETLPEYVGSMVEYPPSGSPGRPFQDSTDEVNPKLKRFEHTCLAKDKVRYVGEPVAVVVAEDRYVAEDALDVVNAEYEVLPAVVDEVEGAAADAPLLYEEWGDNVMLEFEVENGDVDRAFEESDHLFEEEIRHHRFTGTPMEPRAVLAEFDSEDVHLRVTDPVQSPHRLATTLENSLDIPALSVDVIAENIGGGFGQKTGFYPEDLLVSFLATHLDRPVKWVEGRTEHMVATVHAREQTHRVRVGVNDDGSILGLEDEFYANSGAAYPAAAIPAHITTSKFIPGAYTIQDFRCRAYGVATNKTPFGAHRGFGKAESSYVIERLMDIVSTKLDIDPAEIRFRNFIDPDEFPYMSASGNNYDSGDYPAALERALELVDYEAYRDRQRENRDADAPTQIGIGIATCVEPSSAARKDAYVTPGYYALRIRLGTGGMITVFPEDPDIGTSHESSIVKIVTNELNVAEETVKVVQGNTKACPYGTGTYSSRFSVVGTTACYQACERLADQLKKIAAHNMDASENDLVLSDNAVQSPSTGESMSFEELASIAYHLVGYLPDDMEPGLEFIHYAQVPNVDFNVEGKGRAGTFSAYPYTADIAVVEIDMETGNFDVLKYVTVHDCGNILDEKVVEGQHLGALAHGFGGAMYEELPYDDYGQPHHRSFMDYLVPTANEVPDVEMDHLETPSPFTPGGHKGAGETGAVSVPPAITNAVEDGLRPLQVEIREAAPMRPDYIWEKINQARAASDPTES